MSSRRTITQAILCIAAVAAAMPAAAHGGSLLSGYGGPGQGSQVILGSALVNGPPNGGGGSGGGGSGSEGSSTGTGESSTAAKAASGVATGAVTRSGGGGNTPTGGASHRHAAGAGRRVSGSSSAGARPYSVVAREAALRQAAEGSEPLGVTGSDLMYILLALGALILTGFITLRMAHTSAARDLGS